MPIPFLGQIYESLKQIQEIQKQSKDLKQIPESKQSNKFRPDQGISTKGESSKLGGYVPEWVTNKEKDNTYFKTTMPDEYGYDTLGKKEFTVTDKKPKDPVLPDWFMNIAGNDLIRGAVGRVVTNIFDKEYELTSLEKAMEDPLGALDSILRDEKLGVEQTGDEVFNGVPYREVNSDALMRDMFGLEHRSPNDLIKQKDGTYAIDMTSEHTDAEEIAGNLIEQKRVVSKHKGKGISWLLGHFNIQDKGDSYGVYDKWDVAINDKELLTNKELTDKDKAVYALRHLASAFIKPSEVKFDVKKKDLLGWEEYFKRYETD